MSNLTSSSETVYSKFKKFVPDHGDKRSKKSTPFDRHAPKPWYLGKLRYKGYWRSYEVAARGRSQYSTSLASLAGYLHSNGIATPGGIFLDAGCGDSPDALLATRELGYEKAIKVDLFVPTYDEYGVTKYDLSHYYSSELGHKGIRDQMKVLEKKYKVSFLQGDLCEPLPIGTSTISAISCNAVVDLIKEEDKIAFYKQMYRILKPGGLLCICFVPLAAGYGSSGYFEHDICTLPEWGVRFKSIRKGRSVLIFKKPEFIRDSKGRFAKGRNCE